jgi:hypothetical protein
MTRFAHDLAAALLDDGMTVIARSAVIDAKRGH